MKPGRRALGIAASDREQRSHLAGAVVRASRVVDGFVFGRCTVAGSDATERICGMIDRLDREDVAYLLVAGIAPAWFNLIDLQAVHDHTGLPTLSISFESSPGLEGAIRDAFDDAETVRDRLTTYRSQPERHECSVNDETVYVRSVGLDADERGQVVRAYTPAGGRPEPLRVARLAARAAADDAER